jgi:acetoin utilization protein AcuB
MQERKDLFSVGQWMTANPETVSPDISVRSAFFKMRLEGYRHLLVEEEGKLVGIVSDRDLRRPDISNEPDGWNDFYNLDDDYEVRYVMTRDVHTVTSGDPLEKALKLMTERKFNALPVLDKRGKVIGILSSHDLLRAFQATLQESGEMLRSKK